MKTIGLQSIRQIVFARERGVRIPALEYNGELYGISDSKDGPYVFDYVHECPGWASRALPPSRTSDGNALTAALRGKSASPVPTELKGKELQQFMRSGADFSKAIFTKIEFEDIDLQGLDLRGARFIDCKFHCANLTKARLEGTRFYGCVIDDCDISEAQAGQSNRSKKSPRTQFRDCRLTRNSFAKAELSGALYVNCVGSVNDWANANLYRAVIANCYLSNAAFALASLKEATFLNLNRVTPEGLPMPFDGRTNPKYGNFAPINLLKTDLTDAKFLNCQLSGSVFGGTGFCRTVMVQSNIDRCVFGVEHSAVKQMLVDRATQSSWGGNGFTKADPAWDAPGSLENPKLVGNLQELVKGEATP